MSGLRLPKPAAPLPGLPAPSPAPKPQTAPREPAPRSPGNGKGRDLGQYDRDQLETMLGRVDELLRSTTLASLSPSGPEKLAKHREALQVELRQREVDETLERTRIDGMDSDAASPARTSPKQALRTRLLAQPAVNVGRMRGISMEATMALESDAAARRRAAVESSDYVGRLRDLKIGGHAQPRFGYVRRRRERADRTETMHTSLPTTTAIRASSHSTSRRTEATWRTSTRALEGSASRRHGLEAMPRPTTTRRRGDGRYSRTRIPTMASPSMPSIEIHACVFTASVSCDAIGPAH